MTGYLTDHTLARLQLVFNLAILWTVVFLILCRGIQSFGKIVYGLIALAFVGLIAICSKLLTLINYETVQVSGRQFVINLLFFFAQQLISLNDFY